MSNKTDLCMVRLKEREGDWIWVKETERALVNEQSSVCMLTEQDLYA